MENKNNENKENKTDEKKHVMPERMMSDRSYNKQIRRQLMPYFLLAVAVIIAYRIIERAELVFVFTNWFFGVITPFFYGFLLAYVLSIPCTGLRKLLMGSSVKFLRKFNKAISIVSVYVALFLVLTVVLNLLIPAIYDSVLLFVNSFPSHYENLVAIATYVNDLEIPGIHFSVEALLLQVQTIIEGFSLDNLVAPIDTIFSVSNAIFSGVFVGVLAFISSIYILAEKEKFKAYIRRVLAAISAPSVYVATIGYATNLNNNFKQYIKTQTLDGLILGTMATLALTIMVSPYALLLGVMLGIVNYVPYFGSIFGTIATVLVVAFTQGITMGLIAAVVLLVLQQIDANVIQPRLMSGSFSLSPLLVIVSISIGSAIAGIFGMIAAIPIVAVLKDIFESFIEYCERNRFSGRRK